VIDNGFVNLPEHVPGKGVQILINPHLNTMFTLTEVETMYSIYICASKNKHTVEVGS
jgi:hypothetical protein